MALNKSPKEGVVTAPLYWFYCPHFRKRNYHARKQSRRPGLSPTRTHLAVYSLPPTTPPDIAAISIILVCDHHRRESRR